MLFNYLEEVKKNDWPGVPIITGDKDTDALLEDERISQEDGEPTTADEFNKEWLNENRARRINTNI